ncbi:MFS transporter [Dongshaea marina]|uniref:MFS transporter n=1 Tax=Dongshaea marina TaxID=2047966 RepID=UPI0022790E85|nr:MFS transporter [Dongshaea marina]
MHTSTQTIGDLMSVYFPVYAVFQILAGYLLDRYKLRLILSLAVAIVAGGLLMIAIPSLGAILAGRVLIAIGSAFAFLGALKTASMWLPEKVFPVAVGLINTMGVLLGGSSANMCSVSSSRIMAGKMRSTILHWLALFWLQ